MMEIDLPDGTIAEFPDGTSRDVIKGVLQKRFGFGKPSSAPQGPPNTDFYNKPHNMPSKTSSFLQGLGDMLTFGAGDEMMAGIRSAVGPNTYGQELEMERLNSDLMSGANPNSFMAGQVGGAIIPGMLTGGAGAGGSLLARTGLGAASGAAQGAAYGFNAGQGGMENRLENAGTNAAVGGAIGFAAPLAGRALGAGWKAFKNRGPLSKAQQKLIQMLERTGVDPAAARQQVQALGPDAMLADINPGMQATAGGTAIASPSAQTLMAERLANRREMRGVRGKHELDQIFGPYKDPYAMKLETKAAHGAISPEYAAAVANAPQLPKSVEDLAAIGLTHPAKGMELVDRKIMLKHMESLDDALAADTPSEVADRLLRVRSRLGRLIAWTPRDKAKLLPEDNAAQPVHRQAWEFVGELLKDRVPGIKEADAKYAPVHQLREAFDYGRDEMLKGGPASYVSPEENAAILARMNPARIDATKQGLRGVFQRMMGGKDPAAAIDRITRRDMNDEKIAKLIGQPDAERLDRMTGREEIFTNTSKLVEPQLGSRTSVNQAAAQDWNHGGGNSGAGDALAAGLATTGATGSPMAGVAAASGVGANRIKNAIMSYIAKPNDAKIKAVGAMLTAAGPQRDAILQALEQRLLQSATSARQAQKIERTIQTLIAPQWPLLSQRPAGQ